MGDTPQSFARAKIVYPLAMYFGLYQGFPPKRVGQPSGAGQNIPETAMSDDGYRAVTDAAKLAVHHRHVQRMQIGHIAGHIYRRDLIAGCDDSLPAKKAA
ncbi:hypothetical protein GCM10010987_25580 [Bradyrhizobium guangdongense]|uniref:Uncharacterized protein n=1 Tax=Bradyrhizobium guangdongense TaxID=1325090 RepID=A0AA87W4G6_9BRAD|nr:hypothetical protein GCM10010987_25580 [Bradyrhizobium guangdongense]